MKFAKNLEEDLVPEWRAKYLSYKEGKKKIKAVSRALRTYHRSPVPTYHPALPTNDTPEPLPYTNYDFKRRRKSTNEPPANGRQTSGADKDNYDATLPRLQRQNTTRFAQSPPIVGITEGTTTTESSPDATPVQKPLRERLGKRPAVLDSSIIGTPQPEEEPGAILTEIPSLHLPAPAMGPSRKGRSTSLPRSLIASKLASINKQVAHPDGRSRRFGELGGSSVATPASGSFQMPIPSERSGRLPGSNPSGIVSSRNSQIATGTGRSNRPYGSQTTSAAFSGTTQVANSSSRSNRLTGPHSASVTYSSTTQVADQSPLLSPRTAQPQQPRLSRIGSVISSRLSRYTEDPITPRRKSFTFAQSRLLNLFHPHAAESHFMGAAQQEALKELDTRQHEFYTFLDAQLDKIEDFYKMKENEANERLGVLRKQLHEMRDRRLLDIEKAKASEREEEQRGSNLNGLVQVVPVLDTTRGNDRHSSFQRSIIFKPVEQVFAHKPSIGKTSQAMSKLSTPVGPEGMARQSERRQDYGRKKSAADQVPYKTAKRKLKLALQEFYRGLELLKSYALLNRTAFRKINKKYDKAINARPPMRYMSEVVSKAYFVSSSVIDDHLVAVEDLYARYFERGSHKLAIGKLRTRQKAVDQSSPAFRNGLFLAAGFCFAVLGLVKANKAVSDPNPDIAGATGYLLQIYGGYFLALLLFLFFVLDCKIWSMAKINYVFVFEFDTRHVLDWRQLAEIPCFFVFLEGLFIYLNFTYRHATHFIMYWPLILIVLTVVILGLPFRILHFQARKWFAYTHWRLLLAGLYPVEFRDFFIGDMYCSETYALGQVELFFCVYANNLNYDPRVNRCTSAYSYLLGFFSALPAVWRALQCLRRYYDTRKMFPHAANCAKYCCNILYYMTLSLWRINRTHEAYRWVFIVFAAINGLYTSFWDVFMDFSLGHPLSVNPFLRDQLAYRRKWVYYVAAILDVIFRHSWLFYALYPPDIENASMLAFGVSLVEVIRRGIWSVFRVENEHCNNVGEFRASRDIALPYELPDAPRSDQIPSPEQRRRLTAVNEDLVHDTDVEQGTLPRPRRPRALSQRFSTGTVRSRVLQRVGSAIATAHAQDFEKKRRPGVGKTSVDDSGLGTRYSSDEDDDEDEDDELGRRATRPDGQSNDPDNRSEGHVRGQPEPEQMTWLMYNRSNSYSNPRR